MAVTVSRPVLIVEQFGYGVAVTVSWFLNCRTVGKTVFSPGFL